MTRPLTCRASSIAWGDIPMNTRLPLLGACAALLFSPLNSLAETPALPERAEAAFVLTLGRSPTAAEASGWTGTEKLSLGDLVASQRDRLRADADAQRAVFVRAWSDAFGRPPAATEKPAGDATYAEQMQLLVKRLAERPDEYREVLDRAYRRVLGRAPFAEEHAYWKAYPTLSYTLLVGCLENWARRNAPGLMATTGTPAICVNSDHLRTLRLSPAVAAEARAVVGLPPAGERALSPARGCNVIAPGAAEVVSVGGVHFTAFGAAGPATAE